MSSILPNDIWIEIIKDLHVSWNIVGDLSRVVSLELWRLAWTCRDLRELALPYLVRHITFYGPADRFSRWVKCLEYPQVAREIRSIYIGTYTMGLPEPCNTFDKIMTSEIEETFERDLQRLLTACHESIESLWLSSVVSEDLCERENFGQFEAVFATVTQRVITSLRFPNLAEFHYKYRSLITASIFAEPLLHQKLQAAMPQLKVLEVDMAGSTWRNEEWDMAPIMNLAAGFQLRELSVSLQGFGTSPFLAFELPRDESHRSTLRVLNLSHCNLGGGLSSFFQRGASGLKTLFLTRVCLDPGCDDTWESVLTSAKDLPLTDVTLWDLTYATSKCYPKPNPLSVRRCGVRRFSGTMCTKRPEDVLALRHFLDEFCRRNNYSSTPGYCRKVEEIEQCTERATDDKNGSDDEDSSDDGDVSENEDYDVKEIFICTHSRADDTDVDRIKEYTIGNARFRFHSRFRTFINTKHMVGEISYDPSFFEDG